MTSRQAALEWRQPWLGSEDSAERAPRAGRFESEHGFGHCACVISGWRVCGV